MADGRWPMADARLLKDVARPLTTVAIRATSHHKGQRGEHECNVHSAANKRWLLRTRRPYKERTSCGPHFAQPQQCAAASGFHSPPGALLL